MKTQKVNCLNDSVNTAANVPINGILQWEQAVVIAHRLNVDIFHSMNESNGTVTNGLNCIYLRIWALWYFQCRWMWFTLKLLPSKKWFAMPEI